MRRIVCALVVAVMLVGCGATGSSLPYRSDDPMGMTIEQYAIGRLPSDGRASVRCAVAQHKTSGRKASVKSCRPAH